MKKIFVLLFPQQEYLEERNDPKSFNNCIQKRYLEKGYEFYVVKYKDSDLGFVSLTPNKIIEANITFKESTPYFTQNWQYANFKDLAQKLNLSGDDEVVVGGFHCNDCVEKFAKEIYSLNQNTMIDSDLTELFWGVSKYIEGWDINNYNPNLRLKNMIDRDYIEISQVDCYIEKYSHPVWKVSKDGLDKIAKCKTTEQNDFSVQ